MASDQLKERVPLAEVPETGSLGLCFVFPNVIQRLGCEYSGCRRTAQQGLLYAALSGMESRGPPLWLQLIRSWSSVEELFPDKGSVNPKEKAWFEHPKQRPVLVIYPVSLRDMQRLGGCWWWLFPDSSFHVHIEGNVVFTVLPGF